MIITREMLWFFFGIVVGQLTCMIPFLIVTLAQRRRKK